jgi:hypothetical protein
MTTENQAGSTVESAGAAPVAAGPPRKSSWRQRIVRILVGAAISFAGLVLLYGLEQAATMVALAVICTAGLGLIPLIFVSWMVGWVVLEAVAVGRGERSAVAAS